MREMRDSCCGGREAEPWRSSEKLLCLPDYLKKYIDAIGCTVPLCCKQTVIPLSRPVRTSQAQLLTTGLKDRVYHLLAWSCA